MAKKLMLGFTNTAGKTVSITIPEPKATLAQADCTAAMDAIIAKNIFLTIGGELVSNAPGLGVVLGKAVFQLFFLAQAVSRAAGIAGE